MSNKLNGLTIESAAMIRDGLELIQPDSESGEETRQYLLSQLEKIIKHLEGEK